MQEYRCLYGKSFKKFYLNENNLITELLPNPLEINAVGEDEVKRAISNPIGSKRLKDIVKPAQKVVIITSDITRPMPSKLVVPHVIEELLAGGVGCDDISIIFAVGSHREHTEEEKKYLVGEETYNRVKCIDSNPNDYVHMGMTKSGTPVDIFRVVAEADIRICLGNIEYHWFAGYSGGAKAIMPGVSTKAAIQRNHRFLVREEAKAGDMENNPVRYDIEEVANIVPIHFIVNVVLDENKNIIKAVAGHHILAHREGCKFLDQFYKVPIKEQADIVIVSAGGFPKDLNLYQAQKALDNARHAVRQGGIIIWAGRCQEGLGEEVFEDWIISAKDPQSILERIQVDFQLGGHKAAAIAGVLVKAQIFLVSELDPELVKNIFMQPFTEVTDALEEAFRQLGNKSKVIFMPVGGSTLPVLNK
ncbi:nickel-dependent lactate racemase [Petroclostridium xylanilyticum]|uniref:nickel-dependent lactate racemase n=1 Tax=Petroclostridium xylanilyticum TaxID=1792311 RepID=UPI000B98572C|nr:nickel-dependent lactate racemase [Petroclostridium xylanilyticum]